MRAHLASLVEEFRQHAAGTAVVSQHGNRHCRTTYGELARIAGRFAAEVDRRGLSPGERVVLWGENSAEWIGVFFGCLLRGVIAVPLDAAGSREFADQVVNDVKPRLIAGDRSLLRSLTTDLPRISFSDLNVQLPLEPLFKVSDAVHAETQFQIVFTSGTTSQPKGIVHTHGNVLASLQPIEDEIARYRKYEHWVHPLRFLHTLPLSHVFGQFMGLWIPPLLAAEVHFGEHLDPRRMIETIHRERISVLVAVPRVLQLLQAHLLANDGLLALQMERSGPLSLWKRWWRFRRIHRLFGWKFWGIVSGGASLPPQLEDFWNALGFPLIQGYGMTETAALVTLNHPFHIGQGTIGKALPGREVRISDEGEILVRGPMLAQATWQGGAMHRREAAWLATGDLAAETGSGELRFLGRKGDVIVTAAGINIHPSDLEDAMMKQPGMRGCVVVPCEGQGGPEPVAVALFSGSDEQMQAATVQTNSALAGYQQIRRVLKWPEAQFPYTSTGKLLRRQVAQWACAALSSQRQNLPQTPVQGPAALLRMIAKATGEPVASGKDCARLSEDLHLDSLGRVQLQSIIEQKMGIELDDDAMTAAETLGDLRSMLAERGSRVAQGIASEVEHPTASTKAAHRETKETMGREPTASAHIYPRWPWSWPVRVLRVLFIELIMRPLIRLLAAPKVVRATSPPQVPVLVIANHVTAYDGALVLYALPSRLRRRMAIAMSGEMLLDLRRGRNQGNGLLNLLAPAGYWLATALFNVFPLPRLSGFRRSFAHAGEAIDHGYSVMVFPEGTRSADGTPQPFRPGTGLLAHESGVPVLPVKLIGLGEIRASKSRWFRSGKLEIKVGQPIYVDEDASPAELTASFEEEFRSI